MEKENGIFGVPLKYILIGVICSGIVFFVIAGLCMGLATTTQQFSLDYTKCKKYVDEETDPFVGSCYNYSLAHKNNNDCKCYLNIELASNFYGKVTIYYTLETFDQNRPDYRNSRDDNQLSGILDTTPSEACEPYRFSGGKPILPCGEIADSMFTDTYNLRPASDSVYVPKVNTGLVSSKTGFNNPQDDLLKVIKNYTKPINWQNNVFQLDTKNPENNGLQNEGFIAWMNTELKRKPAWRVDDTVQQYAQGLPAGNYVLVISYKYPVSRYSGPRIFTIEAVHMRSVQWGFGVFFLILGLLTLASIPVYYAARTLKPLDSYM